MSNMSFKIISRNGSQVIRANWGFKDMQVLYLLEKLSNFLSLDVNYKRTLNHIVTIISRNQINIFFTVYYFLSKYLDHIYFISTQNCWKFGKLLVSCKHPQTYIMSHHLLKGIFFLKIICCKRVKANNGGNIE